MITRAEAEPDGPSGRTPATTAWGPVATPEARRRARAARLDDSPALVVGLVVVLLAWTFGGGALAIALFAAWLVLFVVDATVGALDEDEAAVRMLRRTFKPVILVAREGQRLHFDLSHHKCLFYRTIGKLSETLDKTIREMFGPGGDSAT